MTTNIIDINTNSLTKDNVVVTTLDNGLKVYVYPKKGFSKKIGMFGTYYGSIDTDFFDVVTNKRIKVPDGIAHFLEHKLFEQEDGNALDLFSKMGVSSNAYTSFDHTVYFFETNTNFDECLKTLFKFVTTPYFTDENVEKEKGIIAQELKMYDDEPTSVVYNNVLKCMYNKFPLNVDIGGTVESVYKITKEELYSCYNTFYNPKNMFCIVIGDVNVDETINKIDMYHKEYNTVIPNNIARYFAIEDECIAQRKIEKQMELEIPYVCVGFKLFPQTGMNNVKNGVITEIINSACFGVKSLFYEELYNLGKINDTVSMMYESGEKFSHIIFFICSKEYEYVESKLIEYIEKLKKEGINEEDFNIAKKSLIGQAIFESEDIMGVHRNIINSIIQNTEVYSEENILSSITKYDVDEYIKEYLDMSKCVISRVIPKQEKENNV